MVKVKEFLDNILLDNDTVVCATSGGVDSMTLLNLLIKFKKEKNINIICAHINHNLREESFEEYEFVKKYCNENNIVFEGTIFEKHKSGNFESESRKKRYAFFEEVIKKYSASYLLTAHHGDDLIETILMRMVRGSSFDGYSGFDLVSDRENYKIIRPLVYYSKTDILSYAQENNIEYRDDKTNYDTKYTRNRFRKDILPLLKRENENVHLKFLKFSENMNEASDFINESIRDVYDNIYINNKLDINLAKETNPFLLKKVILKILEDVYGEQITYINDKHVNNIIDIINSDKPNISIDLPLDIIAIKNYNNFEIRGIKNIEKYKIQIGDDDIKLSTGILRKIEDTKLTNNFVCHLDSSQIKLPLYVRNKEDGDFIEVLGLGGKKKIKDIFINEKVNIDKRKSYPIVVDSNNTVLWIPGLKKSKYDSLKTKNYDIILWYIEEEEKHE